MGKKEWLTNLAINVKKRRKELGISQQKLAELSRLSITTITRIEQKNIENPTLDTIEALEHALNLKNGIELLLKD